MFDRHLQFGRYGTLLTEAIRMHRYQASLMLHAETCVLWIDALVAATAEAPSPLAR